jgi:hypothetical protein
MRLIICDIVVIPSAKNYRCRARLETGSKSVGGKSVGDVYLYSYCTVKDFDEAEAPLGDVNLQNRWGTYGVSVVNKTNLGKAYSQSLDPPRISSR